MAKLILDEEFNVLSVETEILPPEHTCKSLFLKSINLWVLDPMLKVSEMEFMLDG